MLIILSVVFIFQFAVTDSFVKHGSFPIPIYQGCYFEIPNDDGNRLLKGPAQSYNNNTPQRCSENCFKMGYLYFGVTYGYRIRH